MLSSQSARFFCMVVGAGLALLGISSDFTTVQSGRFLFVPQYGTPAAIQNFVQPEAACGWMGAGGQVFDHFGLPATGLVVKISGFLEGEAIDAYALTGSSLQFGPGGFDFYLADHPIASNSVTLQLLDISGTAKSKPMVLQTYGNCQQNLLVINFVENFIEAELYFPLVRK